MTVSWIFDWGILASLGIGLSVSGLVLVVGGKLRLSRRQRMSADCEEDLPWEDLLGLMKTRYGAGGKSPENEELSSDALLATLLAGPPKVAGPPEGPQYEPGHPENRSDSRQVLDSTVVPDAGWQAGSNRRSSRRRESNPVEVMLISPFHENAVHGLVINRSTGGLAILTDFFFPPDTTLRIRVVDAPAGTAYVAVRVRHARQASKLWVIGCQYTEEVPWNVKVWFG